MGLTPLHFNFMPRPNKKHSEIQKRKNVIRKRDVRIYKKKGVCALCGVFCNTELHHLRYSDVYDESAIVEVCSICHRGVFH